MHVLLPLANAIERKVYRFGEYILKEGQDPRGLYIVVSGQCRVGSERICVRNKNRLPFERLYEEKKPFTLKGNNADIIPDELQKKDRIKIEEHESLREVMSAEQYNKLMQNNERMFFHERIYRDKTGRKISDHIVYKEMMSFFQLISRDIFGGRVMVTKAAANL